MVSYTPLEKCSDEKDFQKSGLFLEKFANYQQKLFGKNQIVYYSEKDFQQKLAIIQEIKIRQMVIKTGKIIGYPIVHEKDGV